MADSGRSPLSEAGTEQPAPEPHPAVAAMYRLRAATRARTRAERAEQEWREAIRAAFAAGMTGPEVARLAGVSDKRAYQIRDGRR